MNSSDDQKISIGLPLMHLEQGEKRSFLPNFVRHLEKNGAELFLEYGYGNLMGLDDSVYTDAASTVTFVSNHETYQQDIVLVLRCPKVDKLHSLKDGSCLMSMLHYSTQAPRVALLRSLGVNSVSLDSLKDDSGRRLVENFPSVAWNGLEAGFEVLQKTYPDPGFFSPQRNAIHVTLVGAGALGAYTVRAAVRYGSVPLQKQVAQQNIPGVIVTAVDRDITNHEDIMRDLLSKTDMLVDASSRVDTTQAIIPNQWLAYLPQHAVILDLCVDPYLESGDTTYTKGIEGIPQGNLDKYIFEPDDPVYENIPAFAHTDNRRHVVSCYSWPGIHPKDCMQLYGQQLNPIMRTLINNGGVRGINPNGRFFERAIGRALLTNWG
jgi:alanine dehydrogenase